MSGWSSSPIQVRPDVVFRVLGDGAVLVNLADNQVFELNETGSFVWARLAAGAAPAEVAVALSDTFEVGSAEAEVSVRALIADLTKASLIDP